MMKYFRLKPECFLVKGTKRSVLYNLLDGKTIWLSEETSDILLKSELNNEIDPKDSELFETLKKNDLGDYTNEKVYIDKLRAFNIFNDKKFHKSSPQIEIGTFQLNNICNLNCSFCNQVFCPVCMCEGNAEEQLSFNQWKIIFDKFMVFGLKTAILTGGEISLYKDLHKCIEYLTSKGIFITLHTNGIKKIGNIPKDISMVISIFEERQFKHIIENYSEFNNVTLLVFENILKNIKPPNVNWKVKECYISEPKIDKLSMGKVDLYKYHAKKCYDHCLKNKLTVSYNGNVFPCLQIKEQLGNMLNDKMPIIVKKVVEKYWTKSVDKRDSKCAVCEFRYACNSCNLYDPEKNCLYDVRRSVWK